jgi:nitronate monooxygenase
MCQGTQIHTQQHMKEQAESLLMRIRAHSAHIWPSATTVNKARWQESKGADTILAQGLEAGGHCSMFMNDDL